MTTLILPASSAPQLVVSNSAITRIDGATNNAVILHDFLEFRSTLSTGFTLRYPLIIDNTADGVVYDRINFRGNIPADMPWEDWYGQIGNVSFNGACFLGRYRDSSTRKSGVMDDCVWGIRDDLSSGGADGVHHKNGDLIINRPRVWVWRDDFLEVDDSSNITMTINDGFFENQFVWLSVTTERSAASNTWVYANNCLVHMRVWPYRPTTPGPDTAMGTFFKGGGLTPRPRLRMNNVCLAIPAANSVDNNRILTALTECQATNGSRVLVLGGTFPDRDVINALQNAGFSVLEDGAGTAATTEWLNRKAAFLSDSGPVTPPVLSMNSPYTFNFQVGATTLIEPEIVSVTTSGMTSNATTFALSVPAHETGDTITIAVAADYRNSAHLGDLTFVTPNGETVTTVQDFHTQGGTPGVSDNERHSVAVFSFVATADRTAGTMTANWTFSDALNFAVIRATKDTFKVGGAVLATSLDGSVSNTIPAVASMTGVQEKARIFALAGTDGFSTEGFPPAGWISRANINPAGFNQLLLMERTAAATASESVAATNFTTDTTFNWASIGFVILPKQTS